MRVLLTNNSLDLSAGSELYLRDLALELMRRGHCPVAYSTKLGQVANDLRAATVPVIDRLELLGAPPDVIHGHHHYETLTALLQFPQTPAIYYCHGWIPWQEAPLGCPQILRYVAVDELCRERLITEGGVSPDQIEVVLNFFDQRRFPPRPPLPTRPRLALAFGNSFSEDADLPLLREACARCGIELHAAGLSSGGSEEDPGRRLAQYDVVFAKARAAIEAMAVGAAVILTSYGKLGPLVTAGNFAALRTLNFGVRTLARTVDPDLVVAELQRYDPQEAAKVSTLTRENCELQPAVDRILEIYSQVIEAFRHRPAPGNLEGSRAAARYLEQWAPHYKQAIDLIPDRQRWMERCAAAETALSGRDTQLRGLVQDRQRWMERSGAAEAALADRNAQLRAVEQEHQRWMERCKAAEAALGELRIVKARLERERRSVAERLDDAERVVGAMRASATWRWGQQVVRNSLVQGVFGGFIRAVAERSNRSAAPGPTAVGAALPVNQPQSRVQSFAQQMIARHGFLGVPVETFEQAGRSQLAALLDEGLNPESKVLDFGCGCLRIAYWLIRFLDPGGYHGIEPARERVEYGLRYLFSREEVKLRQPHFDYNPRFDSSVFGTKFDFFLARSIWTHAGKSQIEATLDSFVRDSNAASVFLASYLPAESPEDDYGVDQWVGTSHESDTPGVIRHSLTWIVQQCHKRMLQVAELPGLDCDGQLWLRIRHE